MLVFVNLCARVLHLHTHLLLIMLQFVCPQDVKYKWVLQKRCMLAPPSFARACNNTRTEHKSAPPSISPYLFACDLAGSATQTGKAVGALQDLLPNAKVLYSSATGASEPNNLGYMYRLGASGFDHMKELIETLNRYLQLCLCQVHPGKAAINAQAGFCSACCPNSDVCSSLNSAINVIYLWVTEQVYHQALKSSYMVNCYHKSWLPHRSVPQPADLVWELWSFLLWG